MPSSSRPERNAARPGVGRLLRMWLRKTQATPIAERFVDCPCSLPPNKIIGSQLGAPATKRKPQRGVRPFPRSQHVCLPWCGDAWQLASLFVFVARDLRKHVAILEREIAELEQT